MPAYDAASRSLVTNLAGDAGLQALLLRIYDHQRHIFEWARAERPDAGVVFASLSQLTKDRGTSEFSIYDLLKFTHSGASITAQGTVNAVCDAHQAHMRGGKLWNIPNPWTSTVPADTDSTPYHYWKAAEEVRAWRAANGALSDNTRPLLATEVGIDYLSQLATGRTDLNQLRRLKFGMAALGCLYYGCSLVSIHALGKTESGFDFINPTAVGAGQVAYVGAGPLLASLENAAFSPTLPSGIVAGDLLVCISYSRTNTGLQTSSWTTHATLDVNPHLLLVSYKIAAGSGIDAPPTITPSGMGTGQLTLGVVLAFRGVDQSTPFGTVGPASTNAAAEDIGPIQPATPLVTGGAVVVIGARNALSAGGNVSVLSGDGLTWTECVDAGSTVGGFGAHMAINYATWTDTIPTLTAKTFDVAAGLTGAGCGRMILLRPAQVAGGSYYGSGGERDGDYAFLAVDQRETTDLIPFTPKTWRDYWKEWQVAFDTSQAPIAGDSTVCPWPEWNRVTMAGNTITMQPGGRNVVARKKNLRRGNHTFLAELKVASGAKACIRVAGYDKLNGIAVASSATVIGPTDWIPVAAAFTPRQHGNQRVPDPAYAVLIIDHDGVTGTCEARNPSLVLGTVVVDDPPPATTYFDLTVADVTWSPAAPVAGESVTFSASITNIGNAPSPAGVIHGVRFDVNGAIASWSDNVTTSLAAGASRVQTANAGPGGVSTWTAVAGSYTVQAYVDDVNRMPTERDKTNNTLSKTITVTQPTQTISPPAQATAAGLTTLFFNDEFTSLSFYHPTTNPTGTWKFSDYWFGEFDAGFADLGGKRTFCINQTEPRPETLPYLPASQPEPSVMRLTMRRARLSERPALRALINARVTLQTPLLVDQITWLGAYMTTEKYHPYPGDDIYRPAYIEARLRFSPNVTGGFESFWIYSASETGIREIDILENDQGTNLFWQTNVQGGNTSDMRFMSSVHPWKDGNWHKFGLLWQASGLTVYYDDVIATETIGTFDGFPKSSNPNTSALAQSFDTPMRIILTACAHAEWQTTTDRLIPASVEETIMDVDFIRVWRPAASTIRVFPATGTLASGYTVTAGGQNSPVYPVTINTWYRTNPYTTAPGATEQERWDNMEVVNETAGFTAFEMSGSSAPVTVRFNDRTVTSAKVYPARHGITPTITGGNTVNFTATKPGKYIVMINNTEVRPCHVFVSPVDPTAPTASGTGVVYYGPGTHNIGTVTVVNNTTYYIAGGARVVGQFNCAGRTGWKIKGRGVVQASGNFLVGDGASNFTVEGITIIRPLGSTSDWTFKQRNATNFTVDGINVFTCEVTRDGIDSVSCRDYSIKNSFARTLDDPCCINAAFAGLGNIENALLEDCVFMPDNGIGGTEIGASMECTYARNITYRRIDMINPRIQCAMSILNSDYCDVNAIVYNDIHIDGFRGSNAVSSAWLGRFEARQTGFSADPYSPGQIRNIDLYNVTVVNTPTNVCKFLYQGNSTYSVGPVRWHNLRINGTLITSESQTTVSKPSAVGTITYDTAAAP